MKRLTTVSPFLINHRWSLWLLIIITTILWGYAWVLMKLSLAYMGPFTFSAFRFIVGSLSMLFVLWMAKVGIPQRRYWKDFLFIGVLQTSIVFLSVMYGLRFVEAGKSSVLLYSMPIWSSFFAIKFLKENVNKLQLFGLTVGFVGLLTILGWDLWTKLSPKILLGEVLILLGAISWAISNIYYRRRLKDVSLLQVSAWQMILGTIVIIIFALSMEWNEPIHWNVKSVYYVLFTGIIASALCFSVWFLILRLIDLVTATISTLLVPIFGLIFSVIFLQEQLTISILIGSLLIVLGIVLSQISKTSRRTST